MKPIIAAAIMSIAAAGAAAAGTLKVTAKDVDDKIEIYVNGALQTSCEWEVNPGCFAGIEGEVDGTVEIRFVLTNYVYNGFCIGTCGKWAGDLKIEHNGVTLWSESMNVKNNAEGVKYDRTLTCDLSRNSCQ